MGLRKPAAIDDIELTNEELAQIAQDPNADVAVNARGKPIMKHAEYVQVFGKEPTGTQAVQDTLQRDAAPEPEKQLDWKGTMLKGLETLGETADTYGGGGVVRTPFLEAMKAGGLKVPETKFKTGRIHTPSFVDVASENMPPDASFIRKAVTYPLAFGADILTDPLTYTPAGPAKIFSLLSKFEKTPALAAKAANIATKVAPYEKKIAIALNPIGEGVISPVIQGAAKKVFRGGYAAANTRLIPKLPRSGNKPTYMTDEMLKHGYSGGNVDAFLEETKHNLGQAATDILDKAPDSIRVNPSIAMSAPAELSAGHMALHGTPLSQTEYDAAMAYVKQKLGTNLPAETYDKLAKEQAAFNRQTKLYNQAQAAAERNKFTTGVKEAADAEKPVMSKELRDALQKQKVEHPELDTTTLLPPDESIKGLTLPEIKNRLTATAADLPPKLWGLDSQVQAKYRAAQIGMQKLREAAAQKLGKWSPEMAAQYEKYMADIRPFLAENGVLLKASEKPTANKFADIWKFGKVNVAPFVYQGAARPMPKSIFRHLITSPKTKEQGE